MLTYAPASARHDVGARNMLVYESVYSPLADGHGRVCAQGAGASGAVLAGVWHRYSIYLLYWYTSTNSDADGAAVFVGEDDGATVSLTDSSRPEPSQISYTLEQPGADGSLLTTHVNCDAPGTSSSRPSYTSSF